MDFTLDKLVGYLLDVRLSRVLWLTNKRIEKFLFSIYIRREISYSQTFVNSRE